MKNILNTPENEIKDVIPPMGFCLVSNLILSEGMLVGFMYREKTFTPEDSGWRFLSGTESEDYIENPNNSKIIEVNTLANFDPAIIPYLKHKAEIAFERVEDTNEFKEYSEE